MYVVFTINKSEDTKPVHKHVWKHYKKDAGLLKDGTEYDYCSGCKNKKNVKTLKGYANYYVRG